MDIHFLDDQLKMFVMFLYRAICVYITRKITDYAAIRAVQYIIWFTNEAEEGLIEIHYAVYK